MPELSEREKLIKKLYLRFPTTYGIDRFADFIIEDRKKICVIFDKLLSKQHAKDFIVNKDCYIHVSSDDLKIAIETLKLAGLEKE